MPAGHHGIRPVVAAVGVSRPADVYHWPAAGKKIKDTKTMISAADLSKYAKEKKKNPSNQITGVHATPSRCFETAPSLASGAGLASPVFHRLGRLFAFLVSTCTSGPTCHPSESPEAPSS